jgi:hypothetical protein
VPGRGPEAEFQQQVTDLARQLGWGVCHVSDSRRVTASGRVVGDSSAAGLPDLILIRERVVWAELKAPRGRLRPRQVEFIAALEGAGQEVYVWRPADWDQLVAVLSRRG